MPPSPAAGPAPSALPAFLAAAALALAGSAFHLSPWGERASLALLDAGFGILRALGPAAAPDDIIVVGLDEPGAVSAEVDPVGPALRQLPDVLVRVARGKPRAVALHATLPRGSVDAVVAGLDDALATALSVTQAAAPLAIGLAVGASREVVPIHDKLLRGVDTRALVFTLLPRDEDGIVRRVVLGLPTQQGLWPTSAGWLCEVLDGDCRPGLIDYALGPAYRYVPARRLLEIRDDTALARLFHGRIVFVAPMAAPEDRVPQPVSLAGWEPPGTEPAAVLAHAQTVRTLLHGRPVNEAPAPALLLAVAAVALIALAAPALAPVVGVLALAATAFVFLAALRMGWYLPPAGPLATILPAVLASRLLARSRSGEPPKP